MEDMRLAGGLPVGFGEWRQEALGLLREAAGSFGEPGGARARTPCQHALGRVFVGVGLVAARRALELFS